MSKDEAISYLRSKRECVDINIGFIIQLSKWEDFLIPQRTVSNSF